MKKYGQELYFRKMRGYLQCCEGQGEGGGTKKQNDKIREKEERKLVFFFFGRSKGRLWKKRVSFRRFDDKKMKTIRQMTNDVDFCEAGLWSKKKIYLPFSGGFFARFLKSSNITPQECTRTLQNYYSEIEIPILEKKNKEKIVIESRVYCRYLGKG